MTRFARAQGSRSSNQREAEDSTPWHVMVANIRKEGPPPKKKRMGNDKNYQTSEISISLGILRFFVNSFYFQQIFQITLKS